MYMRHMTHIYIDKNQKCVSINRFNLKFKVGCCLSLLFSPELLAAVLLSRCSVTKPERKDQRVAAKKADQLTDESQ